MGCKIHHNTVFKYICLSFLPEGISNDYVKSLPSSMLLPEQMGWTFHRVCMKEASTWMLPLEMDKCCRKEHIQLSLLCTTTEICKWQHCDLMSNQQWFNLKRMMSCQLELESLLPLMQKKTPIYRWALRDTQTDYNVENMCVCVCVVSTVFVHPKNKFCGSCVLIILLPQSLLQPSRCLCVFTYHSVCDSWDRLPDWHCWL